MSNIQVHILNRKLAELKQDNARLRKENKEQVTILNAAGDALFTIMNNERMADYIPAKIRDKIDRWYKLTLKAAGKDS